MGATLDNLRNHRKNRPHGRTAHLSWCITECFRCETVGEVKLLNPNIDPKCETCGKNDLTLNLPLVHHDIGHEVYAHNRSVHKLIMAEHDRIFARIQKELAE